MKKLAFILPLAVILPLVLSGCTGYIAIPEDDSLPIIGAEEIYDDVVPTPGGVAYRANVHQAGEENPWPPVETVEVTLDGANLRYRDYIETGLGETRNNIFTLYREDGFWDDYLNLRQPDEFQQSCLELYAVSIPDGIELSQVRSGGIPGTLATVLVIDIAPEVESGHYELEVGINIKGRDYGTVTCIIEVVDSV